MQRQLASSKRRYGCLGWGLRLGGSVVGLLIVVLLIGAMVQRMGTQQDQQQFVPPGQIVTVDGNPRHLWCMNEMNPAQPTVLLEAGIGRSALDWARVLPLVAPMAHVCAYDRAGYGWSAPGPAPRSLENLSHELHSLLTAAGITSPLLLVGHSYGGAVVQQYSAAYPERVVGVILVDAMHEQEWANLSPEEQQYQAQQEGKLTTIALLNRVGLLRLFGQWLGTEALPIPIHWLDASRQAAYLAFLLRPDYYETWLSEIQALAGTLPPQLPNALPLLVLTAEQPATATDAATLAAEKLHLALQRTFLTLSPNSQQVLVKAGHDLPLENPESVVAAIQTLLAAQP